MRVPKWEPFFCFIVLGLAGTKVYGIMLYFDHEGGRMFIETSLNRLLLTISGRDTGRDRGWPSRYHHHTMFVTCS